MFDVFPPFLLFFAGAVLLPLIPNDSRRAIFGLAIAALSGLIIWQMPEGQHGVVSLAGLDLTLLRVDKLSVIFGLVFSLAAFLSLLYAWHVRDTLQQVATLGYAGSAIGVVFAGDLITLFLFWEGTAITSVFLIWARRTPGAFATGMRYLVIQIASGVVLLGGIALLYRETGSLAFDAMTLGSVATWAILIAFGIKGAFPLLNGWLQDAYPAATVTGTVILSAFTTKLAIYALARGFPGTELLIYIGAIMALVPVFYAVIENDLRRVLVYSLNIQLGFMVVGVGVGTELALSGVAAHAVVHILYKSLLLMAIGAVLYRTGTAKASELGGLYRTMPLTMLFCLVGALASAAFPLFSAFVTKSLILTDLAKQGHGIVWAILMLASAGVVFHSGLKVPYFAFFAQDSGKRPAEAPRHMLLAMGLSAFLCVAIGLFPQVLYDLLPSEVTYKPYSASGVITQLQLLFFAVLAFALMMRSGRYPVMRKSVSLQSDWIYRKFLPGLLSRITNIVSSFWAIGSWVAMMRMKTLVKRLHASHGPEGRMASAWPTGAMVLWMAILLGATMFLNFI